MPLLFSTTWMICLIILIQWSAWLLLFTICAALLGFPWLQWWLLYYMRVYIIVTFTNDLFNFYTLIYIDYIFFSKYISSEMWLSSHTQACGFSLQIYNSSSILEGLSKIKFWSRTLSHALKELFRSFLYKKSRKPLKIKTFGVVSWRPR